jgi:hypothetical protein
MISFLLRIFVTSCSQENERVEIDSLPSTGFKLACDHRPVIDDRNTGAVRVRQIPSAAQSTQHTRAVAWSVDNDQQAMIRGLVHGVLLSLAVWVIAGYVTFALR